MPPSQVDPGGDAPQSLQQLIKRIEHVEEEKRQDDDLEPLIERPNLLEDEKIDLQLRIERLEERLEELDHQEKEIYGTGTIHMLAVSAIVEETQNSSTTLTVRSWLLAIFSLCFVFVQSSAFYTMIVENNIYPCSAHTDCPTGQFCEILGGISNCLQCEYLTLGLYAPDEYEKWNFYREWIKTQCDREEITNLGSVGPDVVWMNEKGEPVYNQTKYPLDNDFNCLAWQHCRQSEIYMEERESVTSLEQALEMASDVRQCDSLTLVRNKVTSAQGFIFTCVVLVLLASQMYVDIEEASIEEALLRKNGAKTFNVPGMILLVSLRHRMIVLPWALSTAVVVITLSDDLSMKNILLNVVALVFILEADSLFVRFCCSKSGSGGNDNDKDPQEKMIEPVREGEDYSWWGPRVWSFLLGLVVIITVLNMTSVVELLNDLYGKDVLFACQRLNQAIWLMLFYGSLVTCIVHALLPFGKRLMKECHHSLSSESDLGGGDDDQSQNESADSRGRGEGDQESRNEMGRREVKVTNDVVFDALFQLMASLLSLYLFALLRYFIHMTYATSRHTWNLSSSEIGTYGYLTLLCFGMYTLLGIIINNRFEKT